MKPYYEHGGITIYHGDCREILPGLTSVGLVLSRLWMEETMSGGSHDYAYAKVKEAHHDDLP